MEQSQQMAMPEQISADEQAEIYNQRLWEYANRVDIEEYQADLAWSLGGIYESLHRYEFDINRERDPKKKETKILKCTNGYKIFNKLYQSQVRETVYTPNSTDPSDAPVFVINYPSPILKSLIQKYNENVEPQFIYFQEPFTSRKAERKAFALLEEIEAEIEDK